MWPSACKTLDALTGYLSLATLAKQVMCLTHLAVAHPGVDLVDLVPEQHCPSCLWTGHLCIA